MRYMRLTIILFALLLPLIFTGCGGTGSNSTNRTVTITLVWPGSGKAASRNQNTSRSRASVAAAQSALVEVYDGTTRIGSAYLKNFSTSSSSVQLNLPAKPLTFYANAYASSQPSTDTTGPISYKTDPKTGLPTKAPGFTPLALTDEHPVSHAMTIVDVGSNPNITFTMENAIFSLVQTQSTVTLDNNFNKSTSQGSLALLSTIQAKTTNGYVLMTGPNSLVFSMDTSNALEQNRANLDPADNTNLLLKASGDVKVTVTDNEVNTGNGEIPITATFTYRIQPHTKVPNLTISGTSFSASLPYYAKSVKYTLTQTPLVDPATNPPVLDTLPADQKITLTTTLTPKSTDFSTAPDFGLTDPSKLVLPLTSSGRTVTLTVQAFSNSDGTGQVLAHGVQTYTVPNMPTDDGTVDLPLTTHVTGFALTPANPTITLNTTNSNFSGNGVNTLTMQVTALLNNPGAVPLYIDPNSVKIASANKTVMTPAITTNQNLPAYLTGPNDGNGYPFILLTGGTVTNATPAPVTTTATDWNNAALTGNTIVTVQQYNPGYILKSANSNKGTGKTR